MCGGETKTVASAGAALGAAGFEISMAYRSSTALIEAVDRAPDAIVVACPLDEELRGFISRLRARARSPIVVVADRADEAATVAAFEAGADDVVSSALRSRELVARIRAVLRNARTGPRDGFVERPAGGLGLDPRGRVARVAGVSIRLTPIEFELLSAVAVRRGETVERLTLVALAWPGRPGVSAQLLRTHLGRLNVKLRAAGHPGIRNVRGAGYALRTEEDDPAWESAPGLEADRLAG